MLRVSRVLTVESVFLKKLKHRPTFSALRTILSMIRLPDEIIQLIFSVEYISCVATPDC